MTGNGLYRGSLPRTTSSHIFPLEIAVFGPDEALRAQKYGADRVELNAKGSYSDGGTTPSIDDLRTLAPHLTIPIRIMIRPRGPRFPDQGPADFVYDDDEFESMKQQLMSFSESRLLDAGRGDGFVFGILEERTPRAEAKNPDGPEECSYLFIDKDRCRQLVDLARPFACVFHRAFDPIAATSRLSKGVRTLVDLGFRGVLTAGGEGDFNQNQDRIEHMARMTAGMDFEVVAGGGVRHHNTKPFIERIAAIKDCGIVMHSAAMGQPSGDGNGSHGGEGECQILSADLLLKLTHVLASARPG